MKNGVLQFFPVRLDRGSAPEACGMDAARVLENVETDAGGRIRRRLGLSRSNVDGNGYSVTSAFFCVRGDGVGMLFFGDAAGNLNLALDPAPGWVTTDDFAAGDQTNENFNEEGESL